jgi:hypothetical protein
MRSQYYYEPPRAGTDLLERLKPLKEPPLAYIIAILGILLGLWLSISDNPNVARYGPRLLILLIAFPIHELAHAITADRLGDSTPRYYGRITLNPLAQLNFLGSFLMLVVGLGWAYVPINPGNLRPNPRTGHMIVAVVGPISNLILAALCAILWQALSPALQTFDNVTDLAFGLEKIQRFGMLIFLLAFFLLPFLGVPILDWLIFRPASAITSLLFFGL